MYVHGQLEKLRSSPDLVRLQPSKSGEVLRDVPGAFYTRALAVSSTHQSSRLFFYLTISLDADTPSFSASFGLHDHAYSSYFDIVGVF